MQEFKMSLFEMEERFTKSEVAIMSWASQETSLSLEKNKLTRGKEDNEYKKPVSATDIPRKYVNEEGEVDLRKVTGKEAAAFLRKQGLFFAPIVRS